MRILVLLLALAIWSICQTSNEGVIKDIQIYTVHGEVKLCVTVDISGVQPPGGAGITGHVSIQADSEPVFDGQVIIQPEPTTQTLCFSLPIECLAHDVGTPVTFQVRMELQQPAAGTVIGEGSRTIVIDAGAISPLGVLDFFIKKIDLIVGGNSLPEETVDALNEIKSFASETLSKANQTPSIAGFNVFEWYGNRLNAIKNKLGDPVMQTIPANDLLLLKRLNDCQKVMVDMIPRFEKITDTISNGEKVLHVPVGFSAIGVVLLTRRDGTVVAPTSFPAFAKPILVSATTDANGVAKVIDPAGLKYEFDCTDEGKTILTYTISLVADPQTPFAFRFSNAVLLQQKSDFPCEVIQLDLKVHEKIIDLETIDELRNVTADNFNKVADELQEKLKNLGDDCKIKDPKGFAAGLLVNAKKANAIATTFSFVAKIDVNIEKCTIALVVCIITIKGSKAPADTVPHEEGHAIIKKKVFRDEMATAIQKIAKCLFEHAGMEDAKGDVGDAVVFLDRLQNRLNDEYEDKTDYGEKFIGKNKEIAGSVPDDVDAKFAECICDKLKEKSETLKKMKGKELLNEISKLADECADKIAKDIRKDWDEKFK